MNKNKLQRDRDPEKAGTKNKTRMLSFIEIIDGQRQTSNFCVIHFDRSPPSPALQYKILSG